MKVTATIFHPFYLRDIYYNLPDTTTEQEAIEYVIQDLKRRGLRRNGVVIDVYIGEVKLGTILGEDLE